MYATFIPLLSSLLIVYNTSQLKLVQSFSLFSQHTTTTTIITPTSCTNSNSNNLNVHIMSSFTSAASNAVAEEEQEPNTSSVTAATTISTSNTSSTNTPNNQKFQFSIDRGGTFTDIHCILPNGQEIVQKLLSEDPDNYPDAPTEGIRRILQQYDDSSQQNQYSYQRNEKVYTGNIESIRMGTTVATNALLERKGEKTGLIITKGFHDLLQIGNQSRENIFDLSCQKGSLLYDHVEEVDERIMLGEFVSMGEDIVEEKQEQEECCLDDGDDDDNYKEKNNECLSAKAKASPRKKGITNESIILLRQPNKSQVLSILQTFQSKDIRSLAIVLTHSYTYDAHEQYIASLAKSMNYFTNISTSSNIMPMIKMVSRGHTACAAAYLTPKISTYLESFKQGFDENLVEDVRLSFMKSDGGLTPVDDFGGHQAILSGPAGGVIGYAKTAYRKGGSLLKKSGNDNDDRNSVNQPEGSSSHEKIMPVIGFDMGGTSTDVSRYDGTLELVFETTTAGVAIQVRTFFF